MPNASGGNARLMQPGCNTIAAALQNWIYARLGRNRTPGLGGLERVLQCFIGRNLISAEFSHAAPQS
jgi:hypothetical protein